MSHKKNPLPGNLVSNPSTLSDLNQMKTISAMYSAYETYDLKHHPNALSSLFSSDSIQLLKLLDDTPAAQKIIQEFRENQKAAEKSDEQTLRMGADGHSMLPADREAQNVSHGFGKGAEIVTSGVFGAYGEFLGSRMYPGDAERQNATGGVMGGLGDIASGAAGFAPMHKEPEDWLPPTIGEWENGIPPGGEDFRPSPGGDEETGLRSSGEASGGAEHAVFPWCSSGDSPDYSAALIQDGFHVAEAHSMAAIDAISGLNSLSDQQVAHASYDGMGNDQAQMSSTSESSASHFSLQSIGIAPSDVVTLHNAHHGSTHSDGSGGYVGDFAYHPFSMIDHVGAAGGFPQHDVGTTTFYHQWTMADDAGVTTIPIHHSGGGTNNDY